MGELTPMGSVERFRLSGRTLIGRTSAAQLRIDHVAVSHEQASIWWSGTDWRIRDLASKNGTGVDGRILVAGETVSLAEGSELQLGDPEVRWQVVSVAPPMAFARSEDGSLVDAVGGLLVLPDEDDPLVTIYQDIDGGWIAETPDGQLEVQDLMTLHAGGRWWWLHFPEKQEGTVQRLLQPTIESLRLLFEVSLDEENVRVIAHSGTRCFDLRSRAHHYVLLLLARARMQDEASGDLDEASRGWVYQDDLAKMLATQLSKVNLAVFRIRQQLAKVGIEGAAGIVERRLTSRQLRIGVSALEERRG